MGAYYILGARTQIITHFSSKPRKAKINTFKAVKKDNEGGGEKEKEIFILKYCSY